MYVSIKNVEDAILLGLLCLSSVLELGYLGLGPFKLHINCLSISRLRTFKRRYNKFKCSCNKPSKEIC